MRHKDKLILPRREIIRPTRRALLGGLAGLIASPAIVRAGTMPMMGAGKPPAGGGGPYVGPGDIASAYAWWGLRAYSNAAIGSNAIRLIRASDSAQQDFATVAGGGLDMAAITTFLASTTGKAVTLYDQTGGTRHLTQATDANRPAFAFNVTNGKPCLQFVQASQQTLACSSVLFTQSQPVTISAVFNRTNSASSMSLFWVGNIFGYFQNANEIDLNASSTIVATTTDGTFQAVNFVANGASSQIVINGSVAGSGNAGSSAPSTNSFILGDFSFGSFFTGYIAEVGDFSSANPALSANQRAYWGF